MQGHNSHNCFVEKPQVEKKKLKFETYKFEVKESNQIKILLV